MSNAKELTEAIFDTEVLQSTKPYLVDFWAAWCGPCRAIAPIIDAIATEHADKLSVGKIDVDAQPAIAQRYRVMSIPTIILFKDGEAAAVSIGAVSKEELLKRLDPFI